MSVADRIRNRRAELSITQTQLAKSARLTPAAISGRSQIIIVSACDRPFSKALFL